MLLALMPGRSANRERPAAFRPTGAVSTAAPDQSEFRSPLPFPGSAAVEPLPSADHSPDRPNAIRLTIAQQPPAEPTSVLEPESPVTAKLLGSPAAAAAAPMTASPSAEAARPSNATLVDSEPPADARSPSASATDAAGSASPADAGSAPTNFPAPSQDVATDLSHHDLRPPAGDIPSTVEPAPDRAEVVHHPADVATDSRDEPIPPPPLRAGTASESRGQEPADLRAGERYRRRVRELVDDNRLTPAEGRDLVAVAERHGDWSMTPLGPLARLPTEAVPTANIARLLRRVDPPAHDSSSPPDDGPPASPAVVSLRRRFARALGLADAG